MSVVINVFFIIGMIFSQCDIKQLLSSKNDVSELGMSKNIQHLALLILMIME